MSRQNRIILTRTLVVLVPLAVYELLCRVGVLDPFSWVPLSTATVRWFELLVDPAFIADTLWPTLRAILISAVAASAAGIVAGTILWRFPLAYRVANPYLTLYYSVPAFAFYPVLLSLVGAGPLSLILLASLLGFAAMTANVVIGFNSTQPIQATLGRAMGLELPRMLRYIFVPSATPQILVGVRLAIAYAIIGVVGGEFLSGTKGLGYYIQFSYDSFDLVDTYATIGIVIVLSLILNGALVVISRLVYPMETVGK